MRMKAVLVAAVTVHCVPLAISAQVRQRGSERAMHARQETRADTAPTLPPPVGAIDFVIDGRTGFADTTKLTFPEGSRVRIVVTNVNPFLYEYSVRTTESPVREVSPLDFFQVAFAGLNLSIPDAPGALVATAGAPILVQQERTIGYSPSAVVAFKNDANCIPSTTQAQLTHAAGVLGRLKWQDDSLKNLSTRLHDLLVPLATAAGTLETNYAREADTVFHPMSSVASVRRAADALRRFIRSFQVAQTSKIEQVHSGAAQLFADIESFRKNVEEARRMYPNCFAFNEVNTRARQYAVDSTGYVAVVERLSTFSTGLFKLNARFEEVLNDETSFYETQLVGGVGGIGDVEVEIRRRLIASQWGARTTQPDQSPSQANLERVGSVAKVPNTAAAQQVKGGGDGGKPAKEELSQEDPPRPSTGNANAASTGRRVIQHRIRIGSGSRYSIGLGLGVSTMHAKSYRIVQRRVEPPLGATSADTVRRVVIMSDGSQQRVFPMVGLSTRLRTYNRATVDGYQFTLGVGLRPQNSTAAVEYFVGPALTFFRNRLTLSPGMHIGQREELANGFALNSRVVGDDVPIQKRTDASVGLGILYRIR